MNILRHHQVAARDRQDTSRVEADFKTLRAIARENKQSLVDVLEEAFLLDEAQLAAKPGECRRDWRWWWR